MTDHCEQLTSSAQRESDPSPWRLLLHGAVGPALLATRDARQAPRMDQRSHQHTRKFWASFRRLTEGKNQTVCEGTRGIVIGVTMLSLLELVLP